MTDKWLNIKIRKNQVSELAPIPRSSVKAKESGYFNTGAKNRITYLFCSHVSVIPTQVKIKLK